MRRLNWRDSAGATAPPRVRVDRFRGSTRRTVHLLGEVRCIQTHRKRFAKDEDKENTVPCLAPDPCPFCADPLWHTRHEHFGPALLRNNADSIWEPIVAVFTPGAWNQFRRQPAGPHRGRVLSVYRSSKGSVPGGVLNVVLKERIEPVIPGFDVEPHLLAMWFPHEAAPPATIPQAVPFTSDDYARTEEPRRLEISDEASAMARAKYDQGLESKSPDELLYLAGQCEEMFPVTAARYRDLAEKKLAAIAGGLQQQLPAAGDPPAPTPVEVPATPAPVLSAPQLEPDEPTPLEVPAEHGEPVAGVPAVEVGASPRPSRNGKPRLADATPPAEPVDPEVAERNGRRRAFHAKPGNEVTSEEVVDFRERSCDFLLNGKRPPTIPFPKGRAANGEPKRNKGGAS